MSLDTVEEFWSWKDVQRARIRAGQASLDRFRGDFGRYIGVADSTVHLMPSGHEGLEWLLGARRDSRRLVMVPAFNCSVVQDAIEAAGFQARLYDFSPGPGQFDWPSVIAEMGAAVGVLIVTHYFGVPVDFRPVLEKCASRGVAVIEDCAHTLGGKISGRQVGTIGDAAIFSFNYDKPISLGWGGVAIINNADAFEATRPSNYQIPSVDEEIALLHRFVEAMVMRRRMIPFQNSLVVKVLRRAGLLKTGQFSKAPGLSMGAIQAELGRWCLANYSGVQQKRSDNAERLAASFKERTWHVGPHARPAWLKQKLLVDDEALLRRVATRLQRKGLRAGNFNWPKLVSGDFQDCCQYARNAATYWMDVPIHQNLDDSAFAEICRVLRDAIH